jgi:hypothetical protein
VHAAQLLVVFQQRGKSVLLGFSQAIQGMGSKQNRNSRTVKEKNRDQPSSYPSERRRVYILVICILF